MAASSPSAELVHDVLRLGQAARAEFAARHLALGRLDHLDAVGLELRDIALRRGVLPHADVHRRRDDDRLVGREQQGRREVVGDARRHLGEQVGGRRADQHEIGRAATAGYGRSRPRP